MLAAIRARDDARMIEDVIEAEKKLREAVHLARSSYDWLEDTPFEDAAHDLVHEIGKEARENFPEGCKLMWNGSHYEMWCPADLVHNRVGFSPELIIHSMKCSICGHDPSECDHIRGETYSVRGSRNTEQPCPVCYERSCDHSPSAMYEVIAIHIIIAAEIKSLSLVSRPVQPDARIQKVSVPRNTIMRACGPDFEYGKQDVSCSKCLSDCLGFVRGPGDPKLAS